MAITATIVMGHVLSLCDANNSILTTNQTPTVYSRHVLPVKYWSAIGDFSQFLGQRKTIYLIYVQNEKMKQNCTPKIPGKYNDNTRTHQGVKIHQIPTPARL